jgi:hypothetical protein
MRLMQLCRTPFTGKRSPAHALGARAGYPDFWREEAGKADEIAESFIVTSSLIKKN